MIMSASTRWTHSLTKKYSSPDTANGTICATMSLRSLIPSDQSSDATGSKFPYNVCAVTAPVIKNIAVAKIDLTEIVSLKQIGYDQGC